MKSLGYIDIEKEGNVIIAKNLYRDDFKENIVYVTSNKPIKSYTGDKEFFIGNKTLKDPEGLNKVSLGNDSGLGKTSCIAIEMEVELEAYGSSEIILLLGAENNMLNVKNVSYKYSNISNCISELNKVKKYWYELVTKIQVDTPLESANIILNGWTTYQTITSRLWSQTGYYQSRWSNWVSRSASGYNWVEKYRCKFYEKSNYGSGK